MKISLLEQTKNKQKKGAGGGGGGEGGKGNVVPIQPRKRSGG